MSTGDLVFDDAPDPDSQEYAREVMRRYGYPADMTDAQRRAFDADPAGWVARWRERQRAAAEKTPPG